MARQRRHDRPDPHELAAARMRAAYGPYEPLPNELRRLNSRKLLVYVALAVGIAALLSGRLGTGAPQVRGSCTEPAAALDRDDVGQFGLVSWSVAGPSGSEVVLTADAAGPDTGRLQPPVPVRDCKATGRFSARLSEGEHVVRVFLRQADGSTRLLTTERLVVNAAR